MSPAEVPMHILAVDCRPSGEADAVEIVRVGSTRDALLALRGAPIDLMLTTRVVDGGPIWGLAGKVRVLRPKLAWWLVAGGIGADDEILARTLGVTRIVRSVPSLAAIRLAVAGPSPPPLRLGRPPPRAAETFDLHSY